MRRYLAWLVVGALLSTPIQAQVSTRFPAPVAASAGPSQTVGDYSKIRTVAVLSGIGSTRNRPKTTNDRDQADRIRERRLADRSFRRFARARISRRPLHLQGCRLRRPCDGAASIDSPAGHQQNRTRDFSAPFPRTWMPISSCAVNISRGTERSRPCLYDLAENPERRTARRGRSSSPITPSTS